MLLDFWSRSAVRGVHQDDNEHLRRDGILTWTKLEAREHAESFDSDTHLHRKLHVNLFPQPFIGNILDSHVYILFGNPGFAPSDYEDELNNTGHQSACTANLQGKGHGFFPLKAASENTGVSNYWRPRLRNLARELSSSLGVSKKDAADIITNRVSLIEAGAYHSKSHPGHWADDLPSSKVARQFVHKVLAPKAQTGEIVLLVWRRAAFWSLTQTNRNVMIRDPSNARHSYLLSQEQKFIVDHLAVRARANE